MSKQHGQPPNYTAAGQPPYPTNMGFIDPSHSSANPPYPTTLPVNPPYPVSSGGAYPGPPLDSNMYQPAPAAVIGTTTVYHQNQYRHTGPSATTVHVAGHPTSSVVMVAQPVRTGYNVALPPNKARISCPSCRETITTKVEYKASMRTHMSALIMCLLLLWCCCWLPYVMKTCKNANHYCPNCGAFIGTALNI